jgi:hypothetical protein
VPDRLAELAKDISEILEMGSFSSTAGPLKLAGRLWFTLSWAGGPLWHGGASAPARGLSGL